MGKKKKEKEIDIKDIKSIRFEFDFSVPKEQFDELLRKMAHLETKDVPPPKDNSKKRKKRKIINGLNFMKLFLYLQRIIE